MADKKISELTNITGANLADGDELVVVDASESETKAITFGEFKTALDTSTGFVSITGDTMTGDLTVPNVIVSGNVDGRDVSADGTKLDGIETNATADQTASEIKTAYESNSDTNAFTDAEQTKLSGIEASADVTDTTNVTAAGALMDSELTNIAAVKALNQGVATTDDPTFTNTQLAELAATISDTAVDIFVYDTSKDSDGGAWRKRTQHTSWYNETLNTATRGSRKEFPSVAVIVAESNQVTIYDGDDPDLPMWMVFDAPDTNPANYAIVKSTGQSISSVTALDGVVATSVSFNGLFYQNFVSDDCFRVNTTNTIQGGNISSRNNGMNFSNTVGSYGLVNATVNDVAMTVLPNAPIDAATGLPVPTIAVATNAGVSVIKDDGTVVDINYGSYNASKDVFFTGSNGIFASFDNVTSNNRYGKVWNTIPSSDLVVAGTPYNQANGEDANYSAADITAYVAEGRLRIGKTTVTSSTPNPEGIDFALPQGVSRLYTYETSPDKGMFSLIASDYNTGWMNGDIKLATLSDTDDTDVTGSELVTNGTFDTDTSGWTGSDATLSVSSGELVITSDVAGGCNASTSITTVIGKTYVISVDHKIGSVGQDLLVGTSAGNGSNYNGPTINTDQTETVTFVATATTTYITIRVFSTAIGEFSGVDNISVRLAEEDRSVNGNGLQVFGTVTKNPVATGADLVAYSGFSSSNYLQQPYNSDLDVGTGDFCIMGWSKATATGVDQYIVDRSADGVPRFLLVVRSDTNPQFYIRDNTYTESVTATDKVVTTGQWQHICGVRRSGVMYIYVDGEQSSSTLASVATISASETPALRVGTRYNGVGEHDGSLALLRISATAPSPEQIKKIYEDEKVLFQENAQATLYGSSDAVTALAYDDSTNLLHVGTSAGRSVFQGLRRVDNTTTAVGAAISASNGLVADE